MDDSSGETIELLVTDGELMRKKPDRDDQDYQSRLWKRRLKPETMDVGSLIKVKGEIVERWGIRKIQAMKIGMHKCG